ncbi:MAG: amidase [Phenylobacterium sp.]|uniref:amidase n=1 Tax=Phenylobacterium sp. TaxID=1871053 RepID=UPI0025EE9C88|nr:amidase [Phenylobacterium sp.]MBA4010977.1 amidase [Phenylobacterium sp.]
MPEKSPLELDLRELSRAITERRWSARDVIEASLSRVATLDRDLHAFCTLDDTAMAQAEDIDRRLGAGLPVGALAGVPVAVKDLICTKDLRTTFGSRIYADFVPEQDDIVVERLKAAGAIIVGKTNTSEFGYGGIGHNHVFPTTRNPWNTALTPGGSSAGSAAAVAARMVPLALGSDGGGSIRIPASLSGVFGMKPSWGRVPLFPGCRDERYPGQSGWESLEHIGPLTRTAADAALALSVISGPSSLDRHSIPSQAEAWILKDLGTMKGARIAYTSDLGFAVVDPEVRAAFEDAIKQLERVIGSVECAYPAVGNTEGLLDTLVALETDRAGLKAMASDRGIKLDGWIGSILDRTWSADQFTAALMERKRIANITAQFMGEFDFLLTPSTATGAFAADTYGPVEIAGRSLPPSAWVPFSALANFTGLPAASVPIGFTADGRPIGLQIMGRHLDDRGVLSLSAVIEMLFQHDRWPGSPL